MGREISLLKYSNGIGAVMVMLSAVSSITLKGPYQALDTVVGWQVGSIKPRLKSKALNLCFPVIQYATSVTIVICGRGECQVVEGHRWELFG